MNIAFSADSSWNRWHPTYEELGQLCKKYNVKYLELVFYPENDKFYQSPEILKNYGVDICCINATAKWRPMLEDDPTESQKKLCECIELAKNCNAKYVIHAVGPIYKDGNQGEPDLLSSAYKRSIQLAKSVSAGSILFPAISTGVYRYPLEKAARIAVDSILFAVTEFSFDGEVSIVCFDIETKSVFDALD